MPNDRENGLSSPLLRTKPSPEEEPTSRQRNPYMDWWLRKWRLLLYTVCLLVASVGNTVFFKRMTSAMPNYGWYLTQLSTLIYVRKFALMGVFDGLSGTFMVLGGVHTSGTLQVLLGQAVIPVTMMLSVLLLRKQYHVLQYLGATTIIMGIVLDKAKAACQLQVPDCFVIKRSGMECRR
ncbi:crtp1 [Symbiodinium pilosum]|uniref:Crtp1 protein n=1 Tax=Symbiodinium pilosum TaxID=2952 RepID=A0A812NHE4_SYMPI|nr:crtp1 [Symbiodinium pilosum]